MYKRQVASIEFFTIADKSVRACDLEAPASLRERFGLNHRFVENEPSPDWLTDLYDEIAAGMSIGGRREILGACRQIAGPDYIHVNGNLGGIVKALFWHSPHPKAVKLRALAKEFLKRPPCIVNGIREWQDSLPELPASFVYDLMYIEQRMGRWASIGETAANLFYRSATPFASRELFEAVAGMPEAYKPGGRLAEDFVEKLWPQLLEVEFCKERKWIFVPKRVRRLVKRLTPGR